MVIRLLLSPNSDRVHCSDTRAPAAPSWKSFPPTKYQISARVCGLLTIPRGIFNINFVTFGGGVWGRPRKTYQNYSTYLPERFWRAGGWWGDCFEPRRQKHFREMCKLGPRHPNEPSMYPSSFHEAHKAFDSVFHHNIWDALAEQRASGQITKICMHFKTHI